MVLFVAGAAFAQQRVQARIAGLEQHTEYMSLLQEDATLQQREDSISVAMIDLRRQLREDPSNRQKYAQEILQSENRLFEVRNAKGRVMDRINAIEQEWVLKNLNATLARQEEEERMQGAIPDSLKRRNLIENRPFQQHLTRQDYASLRRAQQGELQLIELVNQFMGNYLAMKECAEAYATVPTEAEAMALQGDIDSLAQFNRGLSDRLAEQWSEIYDNKSYAYDYLMEALRKETQLDRQQERHAQAMREARSLAGKTVSDELVDYFLRKQALVAYETAVAEELTLTDAVDSLRGIREQLSTIDFKLPRIEVEERYFIDYDTLTFSPRPQYTTQNPIPECKIYQRGTIYRVLLGEFSSKRPVTIFRGTAPISYLVNDEGKWCYFAGGFATHEEALEAQARLKKRGFVRPEVVVWIDGEYRNLDKDPLPTTTTQGARLEITGVAALGEEVLTALRTAYPTAEVSRIGASRYVIGIFDTMAIAEEAAAVLRSANAALEIKVVELTQTNE